MRSNRSYVQLNLDQIPLYLTQNRSKMKNRPKENARAGRDKFPFCTFVLQKYGQYNKCRIETIGGESGV